MTDIRMAAVQAAERGWAVFPVAAGTKTPRGGLSWPNAACSDPTRIEAANWQPGENYGIAAKLSGLVILDLDMPKAGRTLPPAWRAEPGIIDGKDVLAALAERAGQPWPSTFTVQTPSGGWHLYYRAIPGRAIGNRPLGPMIDVRGGGDSHGGYVVGPGSVIGGQAYEVIDSDGPVPLPGWIADLLDPPRAVQLPYVSSPRLSDRIASRLDGLIAAVLDAREGERNNVLHWAACRAAEMVAAGQLAAEPVYQCLGEAARRAGLAQREATAPIGSAMRSAT